MQLILKNYKPIKVQITHSLAYTKNYQEDYKNKKHHKKQYEPNDSSRRSSSSYKGNAYQKNIYEVVAEQIEEKNLHSGVKIESQWNVAASHLMVQDYNYQTPVNRKENGLSKLHDYSEYLDLNLKKRISPKIYNEQDFFNKLARYNISDMEPYVEHFIKQGFNFATKPVINYLIEKKKHSILKLIITHNLLESSDFIDNQFITNILSIEKDQSNMYLLNLLCFHQKLKKTTKSLRLNQSLEEELYFIQHQEDFQHAIYKSFGSKDINTVRLLYSFQKLYMKDINISSKILSELKKIDFKIIDQKQNLAVLKQVNLIIYETYTKEGFQSFVSSLVEESERYETFLKLYTLSILLLSKLRAMTKIINDDEVYELHSVFRIFQINLPKQISHKYFTEILPKLLLQQDNRLYYENFRKCYAHWLKDYIQPSSSKYHTIITSLFQSQQVIQVSFGEQEKEEYAKSQISINLLKQPKEKLGIKDQKTVIKDLLKSDFQSVLNDFMVKFILTGDFENQRNIQKIVKNIDKTYDFRSENERALFKLKEIYKILAQEAVGQPLDQTYLQSFKTNLTVLNVLHDMMNNDITAHTKDQRIAQLLEKRKKQQLDLKKKETELKRQLIFYVQQLKQKKILNSRSTLDLQKMTSSEILNNLQSVLSSLVAPTISPSYDLQIELNNLLKKQTDKASVAQIKTLAKQYLSLVRSKKQEYFQIQKELLLGSQKSQKNTSKKFLQSAHNKMDVHFDGAKQNRKLQAFYDKMSILDLEPKNKRPFFNGQSFQLNKVLGQEQSSDQEDPIWNSEQQSNFQNVSDSQKEIALGLRAVGNDYHKIKHILGSPTQEESLVDELIIRTVINSVIGSEVYRVKHIQNQLKISDNSNNTSQKHHGRKDKQRNQVSNHEEVNDTSNLSISELAKMSKSKSYTRERNPFFKKAAENSHQNENNQTESTNSTNNRQKRSGFFSKKTQGFCTVAPSKDQISGQISVDIPHIYIDAVELTRLRQNEVKADYFEHLNSQKIQSFASTSRNVAKYLFLYGKGQQIIESKKNLNIQFATVLGVRAKDYSKYLKNCTYNFQLPNDFYYQLLTDQLNAYNRHGFKLIIAHLISFKSSLPEAIVDAICKVCQFQMIGFTFVEIAQLILINKVQLSSFSLNRLASAWYKFDVINEDLFPFVKEYCKKFNQRIKTEYYADYCKGLVKSGKFEKLKDFTEAVLEQIKPRTFKMQANISAAQYKQFQKDWKLKEDLIYQQLYIEFVQVIVMNLEQKIPQFMPQLFDDYIKMKKQLNEKELGFAFLCNCLKKHKFVQLLKQLDKNPSHGSLFMYDCLVRSILSNFDQLEDLAEEVINLTILRNRLVLSSAQITKSLIIFKKASSSNAFSKFLEHTLRFQEDIHKDHDIKKEMFYILNNNVEDVSVGGIFSVLDLIFNDKRERERIEYRKVKLSEEEKEKKLLEIQQSNQEKVIENTSAPNVSTKKQKKTKKQENSDSEANQKSVEQKKQSQESESRPTKETKQQSKKGKKNEKLQKKLKIQKLKKNVQSNLLDEMFSLDQQKQVQSQTIYSDDNIVQFIKGQSKKHESAKRKGLSSFSHMFSGAIHLIEQEEQKQKALKEEMKTGKAEKDSKKGNNKK